MSTATLSNGRPQRKQLADQLDRLDTIIDALAEALPAAVSDACREGARQAVREALVEVLTNPDLRALVHPAPAPAVETPTATPPAAAEERPGFWSRIGSAITGAVHVVRNTAGRLRDALVARWRSTTEAVTCAVHVVRVCPPLRRLVLLGTVVLAAAVLLPGTTMALLGAVSGAAAVSVHRIGHRFRSLFETAASEEP